MFLCFVFISIHAVQRMKKNPIRRRKEIYARKHDKAYIKLKHMQK